jgi:heat-inducible transcriptional repressor
VRSQSSSSPPGQPPASVGKAPVSERQGLVLRAIVTAYVAEAAPASSATVSHLLPVSLSSASIRNTMAELASLGLIEKPHASAGRVPTERGIRLFVDHLLDRASLPAYDRRAVADELDSVEAADVMPRISQLLSLRTHQLGFALRPRLERLTLRHISLVRVAENRLLVVVVPKVGPVRQRVVDDVGRDDQAELDQMAAALNERVVDRTLPEVRGVLERELRALENEARSLLFRSLALGLRIFEHGVSTEQAELVITTRSALLAQPEFNDPDRIRGLMTALETNERLVDLLGSVLEADRGDVSVALGAELEEPALRSCAVVAVPYGGTGLLSPDADEYADPPGAVGGDALGVLGVIGPSRMDYARVIPLVSYCSRLVTRKLGS